MERNQKEIFGYGIKDEIRYKLLIKCGLINHLEIFKEESFLAGYEIMSCEAEFIQQVINQLQNFRIRLIPN